MSRSLLALFVCCIASVCRGQYLYKDTPYADGFIKEYEGEIPSDWYDYTKPGIVEFYSPQCVSDLPGIVATTIIS